MDISIIICTYNRAHSLRDTLDAVRSMSVRRGRAWEVVVVDNNSSDDTRALVNDLATGWPILRYEFEPKQGLSHARNRGLSVAQGDLLLFTDDDVLPEPDWMEMTISGLAQHDADACGGLISPIWEVPPPKWLTPLFYGFLAIRNERSDDYPIDDVSQSPYGANMAIKRNVIERVGPFDTSRGRNGKVLASGEDGEMFERIIKAGFKVIFLGGARVHHKVEAFRLEKRYFRRWRYQTSRNIAITQDFPGTNRILNVPLYLVPQLLRALWRGASSRLSLPADRAFAQELLIFHFLGIVAGLLARRNQICRVEPRKIG